MLALNYNKGYRQCQDSQDCGGPWILRLGITILLPVIDWEDSGWLFALS